MSDRHSSVQHMFRTTLLALCAACSFPVFGVERILDAERAIEKGAPLSTYTQFAAHPLYPYLQYYHYRNHPETIPAKELVEFFQVNPRAPYSGWLAEQVFPMWLENGDYRAIIAAYSPYFADRSIECQWRLALRKENQHALAEVDIDALWLSGKDIEPACTPLFRVMRAEGSLTEDLIGKRFQRAMQANHLTLAISLQSQLRGAPAKAANIWLAARQEKTVPEAVFDIALPTWRSAASADILYHLAGQDTGRAATFALTADQLQIFSNHPHEANRALNRLTARLAQQDDPLCEAIFRLIAKDHHDADTVYDIIAYEQRMKRWPRIIELLTGQMGAQELDTAEYQYWLAKSYARQGKTEIANHHYRKAARKRDFFGFLAAEKLALPAPFNARRLYRPPHLYHTIVSRPEAYRIRTFMRLGKPQRALPEFTSLIKGLNREQLEQAALFADDLGWSIQAIALLTRTRSWDALQVRFPIHYRVPVNALARRLKIAPAKIFAVIRKESIFQTDIRSPAGAIGLMQLLPGTARHIARQYGLPYRGEKSLEDPLINLPLGSHYLRDQLRAFSHLAYAAAAYNAGPTRVSQWLTLYPDLPLDEWIAQIPFSETRNYVKRVLEYEKIYEYRLGLPYSPFSQETLRLW